MSEPLRLVRLEDVTERVESGTAELVEGWLDRRSPHTSRAYRGDLERLATWLGVGGIEEAVQRLLGMGQGELNRLGYEYQQALRKGGKSPATANRALAAIRSLFKMGRRFGVTGLDVQVDPEKHRAYRDTQGPPLTVIRRMVKDLGKRAKSQVKSIRDLAIVRLLFNSGLRCHEVVGVDLEHYDGQAKRLSILGKGRSQREWVDLSAKPARALRAWVKVRGRRAGPLFVACVACGSKGGRRERPGDARLEDGREAVGSGDSEGVTLTELFRRQQKRGRLYGLKWRSLKTLASENRSSQGGDFPAPVGHWGKSGKTSAGLYNEEEVMGYLWRRWTAGPLTRVRPGFTRLRREDLFRLCQGYGVRPHGLRHAAISQGLRLTNGNVPEVMAFSRHLNPAVLMIYDDNRKRAGLKVSTMLDRLA